MISLCLKMHLFMIQKNDLIIGDWHPNETGHKKIAKAILQSKEKNGLKEFTFRNCQNK